MSSGVEFEEDKWLANRQANTPVMNRGGGYAGGDTSGSNVGGIAGWLIRHHLAKTEKSAQIIQLVLIVINFIITIFVVKTMI